MKIELDYLASVINIFLDSDNAHIDARTFLNTDIYTHGGFGCFNEKFLFHIQIAIDSQLIATVNGSANNLKDVGIVMSGDGHVNCNIRQIRLTQKGHDFACMLGNKEVLTKLKEEFGDAPFKLVFESGQKLFQHFMKKKLDSILE